MTKPRWINCCARFSNLIHQQLNINSLWPLPRDSGGRCPLSSAHSRQEEETIRSAKTSALRPAQKHADQSGESLGIHHTWATMGMGETKAVLGRLFRPFQRHCCPSRRNRVYMTATVVVTPVSSRDGETLYLSHLRDIRISRTENKLVRVIPFFSAPQGKTKSKRAKKAGCPSLPPIA